MRPENATFLVAAPHGGPGAQSAPKDAGNQPRVRRDIHGAKFLGWLCYIFRVSHPGHDTEGTSMKYLKRTGVLAAALALSVASPALSHHSHAMFDHSKDMTISGTVTEFVFRNPHV